MISRSQADANFFLLLIGKGGVGTFLFCRICKGIKGSLGTADGADIQDNTHKRSQPHIPGMGNPIPIDQGDIGAVSYSPKGL